MRGLAEIKAEFERDDRATEAGAATARFIAESQELYGKLTPAQIAKEKRRRFAEFLAFTVPNADTLTKSCLKFCFDRGYAAAKKV